MKKSKPYRATVVKEIRISDIIRGREGIDCDVGLDMSKEGVLACVRWRNGYFERPWRVKLEDLPLFIAKLKELGQGRDVVIAMEPTGTYCDPLRQALHDAGLKVYRVSPKASHDYAEIFDGVPSQHDGKDAACVAELAAINKRIEWEWDLTDPSLQYEVDWMDAQQKSLTRWLGRMEGLLARHWPEVTGVLRLSSSTLLKLLVLYGGPEGLAKDEKAAERLRKWGGRFLQEEKIVAVVRSAKNTLGVRQRPIDVSYMQRVASQALQVLQEVNATKGRVKNLIKDDAQIQRLAAIVGPGTAAVCWVHLDNPTKYHCANAYLKAFGLNLKVRSSGYFKGQLKITKRGPSVPRRWLYFAAMRFSRDAWIQPWYQAKKARGEGYAKRALVALMRKIVSAMYHVAQGGTFDVKTLLPGATDYQEGGKKKPRKRKSKV